MKRLTLTLGLVALAARARRAAPAPRRRTAAPAGSVDPNAIVVTAKDLKFSPTAVSVTGRRAVRRSSSTTRRARRTTSRSRTPSGAKVFKGEIVSSQKVTYQVPALAAGTYPFICEVHPDMKGTITVE